MEQVLVKDRLRLLLDHFGAVGDPREACKVKYPLREVLFLVTCASIAGCDDYDEIADWGEHHLGFLKRFAEYHFGTPQEDWLRVVLNRIDPGLFEACFMAWAKTLRTDAPDLIALDGKTLRRSGDDAAGLKPLHVVSAWASTQRLVLAQEAVDAKDNECAAILAILGRLDITGASSPSTPSRPTRPSHAPSPRGAAITSWPSSATSRPCMARWKPTSPILPRQACGPSRHRQGPWPHRDPHNPRQP